MFPIILRTSDLVRIAISIRKIDYLLTISPKTFIVHDRYRPGLNSIRLFIPKTAIAETIKYFTSMLENTDSALIEFRELASRNKGEVLEQLIRSLARNLGLNPAWSGRGPNQGRDLILTEDLRGDISRLKVTWLVSCKHFAESGVSVSD